MLVGSINLKHNMRGCLNLQTRGKGNKKIAGVKYELPLEKEGDDRPVHSRVYLSSGRFVIRSRVKVGLEGENVNG